MIGVYPPFFWRTCSPLTESNRGPVSLIVLSQLSYQLCSPREIAKQRFKTNLFHWGAETVELFTFILVKSNGDPLMTR